MNPNFIVTRENGGFVVRQGGPAGPAGPEGPPGPAGGGDVTQAELDAAVVALQAAIDARQLSSEKGGSNGYAGLDASGHVPAAQLTLAALVYKGTWNATTNTPSLVDGTGTSGDSYRVAVEGTRNLGSGSKDWEVGDFVLYNGTIWEQLGGATGVSQVELDAGLATKADTSHTHAQSDVTGLVAALTAKQPLDTDLTALAGLTSAANNVPLFTGSGTATSLLVQPFMQIVSQYGTDAATVRGILGVGTGGTSAIVANTVTTDYTLVLTDAGTVVEMNAATAKTITVPLASSVAFPDGTQIEVCRYGTGALTIAPTPVVSDTFTDTNGDDLATQHTGGTGATWTEHPNFTSGAVDIQANRIRCVTAPAVHYASGVPASADYEVEGVVYVHSNLASATISLLGRCSTSASTYYQLRYIQTTAEWGLFSVVAGVATTLDSASQTLLAGASYTLKLSMRGTTIKGYVDGLEVVSATDSAISAVGRAGVRFTLAEGTATGYHLDSITATDVLIDSPSSTRSLTDQYSTAALRKRSGNEWVLVGDVI